MPRSLVANLDRKLASFSHSVVKIASMKGTYFEDEKLACVLGDVKRLVKTLRKWTQKVRKDHDLLIVHDGQQ